MNTVRDRLWIWGHEAGSHNSGYAVGGQSTIAPAEAAQYLGLSNLILVSYEGRPEPPLDRCARELSALRQVVWSVVGGGGETRGAETETAAVLELASQFPNITGAIMDDFFHSPPAPEPSVYNVQELAAIRERLHGAPRPLDLWVVLYDHQLDLPVATYLEQCDVVTFWTWKAEALEQLEANLARAEALAPAARRVLGCYMFDYGNNQPMPVERMEQQCEVALDWLKSGRIEGIIFLASCICDLGLEAVEWTRRWIAEVGDTPLG